MRGERGDVSRSKGVCATARDNSVTDLEVLDMQDAARCLSQSARRKSTCAVLCYCRKETGRNNGIQQRSASIQEVRATA